MEIKRDVVGAIKEWEALLPQGNVIGQKEASQLYGNTTFGNARNVAAALSPHTIEQLISSVKIAYKHKVQIYPISTGKNWGYGSAAPVIDNCVIFDLSHLRKIKSCDSKLGIFSVQPGVTFEKLFEYLEENNLEFFVPTVGSGSSCSVLGNILERGFGVTPSIDHFQIATSFKVILPNGDLYERPFTSLGGELIDASYKWGVGPYMDGLFTQGAFGIVYEITLCLKPSCEEIKLLSFQCSEAKLSPLIDLFQGITGEYGSHLSGIKIMNNRQSLATMMKYPNKMLASKQIISEKNVELLCKHYNITEAWSGIVAVYGDKPFTQMIIKKIKQTIGHCVVKPTTYSYLDIKRMNALRKKYPWLKKLPFFNNYEMLENMFDGFKGRPIVPPTLSLAYWMKEINVYTLKKANPQRDDCGLIWYTPLVPFKGEHAIRIIKIVQLLCEKYAIEPLMAFNSLSPYCLDLLVPIIFDKHNPEAQERAQQCYLALFEACKKEGYIPYRMNINNMALVMSEQSGFWKLVDDLKRTIDPYNIISPGRYSRIPEKVHVKQTEDL